MAVDFACIMLEGDHVQDAPQILASFGCLVNEVIEQAPGINYCAQGDYEVHLRNNWTVILDPELCTMIEDLDTCAALSERYNCRIFSMAYGEHDWLFGYRMFEKGRRTRRWVCDGDQIQEEGDPLPEEAGTEGMGAEKRISGWLRSWPALE